jgi:lambda family phage portal protein
MAILDFIRNAFPQRDPVVAPNDPTRGPVPRKRRIEAGEVTRLNQGWKAANLAADEEIKRSLETVRARSRDLAYNNEYAKKYLQMVATHIVGPNGFNLQSMVVGDITGDRMTPDRPARDIIERGFAKWAQRGTCEATGRFSFSEFQRMVIETVARDGEAIIMRRRGADNAFGYELKLVEVDRLPVSKSETLKGGNQIVMGIELNADGKAVAYWLNLGDIANTNPTVTLTRIPAEDIIHLYRPGRAEQHRGLPWMHAVMSGLKMLSGFEEAAIVAARVGAAKMGFFTSPDGDAAALADDAVDGEFYQDAEAGAFSVLPPGYTFEQWNPDYPHQNYDVFVKARLRSIASGLGIAYHTLANDLSDVNFSSARAGTLEERDNWIVLQNWFVDGFLRPVFNDWIEQALKKGVLSFSTGKSLPVVKRDKFTAHEWQGRRWQWVDPVKDIEAARLAIKTGISSPQMIAAQNGVDIDDALQGIAEFEARVKESGVTLVDYDLTQTAPESEPASTPDNTMRDLFIAMTRSFEREQPPTVVNVQNPPPDNSMRELILAMARSLDREPPATQIINNVPPSEIRNEIFVEPTPINVQASEVRIENLIEVEPTPITAEVNIEVPAPDVRVSLPSRKTETTVERDRDGNISRATQIETDAD